MIELAPQRHRINSRGDYFTEDGAARGLRVGMKVLGVELARESEQRFEFDHERIGFAAFTDDEILVKTARGRGCLGHPRIVYGAAARCKHAELDGSIIGNMNLTYGPGRAFTLVACIALFASYDAIAAGATGAQEKAAQAFLNAAASGSADAVAYALHPDEARRLRTRILDELRADAATGDHSARSRLFGEASNLAEIQKLNDVNFLAAILRRLRYTARAFERVEGVGVVPDPNKSVHVIVRGRQPPDRGKTQVVAMVTLLPYGKDWKAAVPSEMEAQIEDLLDGYAPSPGLVPRDGNAQATAGGAPVAKNPPEIVAMLEAAERALVENRCDDYYEDYMSPGFRRVTSKKAIETLIATCGRSESTRETLVSSLRIVKGLPPRFEYAGARAVYDTTGRGLPFERYVLERVDTRWYIAE